MTNAILHLNWLMVLLCTVIYYAIGAVWYTVLFGKTWARLNGFDTTGDRSGFARTMIIGFILTFGICVTSGLLINAMGGCKQWDCFLIRSYALLAGLVVCLVGTALNYQQKSWTLWFIDIGYHLVALLPVCYILAKWGMSSHSMK